MGVSEGNYASKNGKQYVVSDDTDVPFIVA